MQVVCEATQSSSSDVQVGAFECLVKIMSSYYDWMKMYMERALFGVSFHSSCSLHLKETGEGGEGGGRPRAIRLIRDAFI